jgi:hypothetical protein
MIRDKKGGNMYKIKQSALFWFGNFVRDFNFTGLKSESNLLNSFLQSIYGQIYTYSNLFYTNQLGSQIGIC